MVEKAFIGEIYNESSITEVERKLKREKMQGVVATMFDEEKFVITKVEEG